jgi:hypothetical protein
MFKRSSKSSERKCATHAAFPHLTEYEVKYFHTLFILLHLFLPCIPNVGARNLATWIIMFRQSWLVRVHIISLIGLAMMGGCCY